MSPNGCKLVAWDFTVGTCCQLFPSPCRDNFIAPDSAWWIIGDGKNDVKTALWYAKIGGCNHLGRAWNTSLKPQPRACRNKRIKTCPSHLTQIRKVCPEIGDSTFPGFKPSHLPCDKLKVNHWITHNKKQRVPAQPGNAIVNHHV